MEKPDSRVPTVLVRLPEPLLKQLEAYGRARGLPKATAVRHIVEEHFVEEPRRQQTRKSLNRMMEIIEYLFATAFEQNKKALTPDKRKEMLADVAESIRRFHPEL